jgi:large subunit ribosomal protein L35
VMRRRAGKNHLLEHKSSRMTRRLSGEQAVAKNDVREIKKLLGK